MNSKSRLQRLARLQRECNVSVAPVLVLCAACAVLVVVLAVNELQAQAAPLHVEQPSSQTAAPAA
jgi:hypothetical protein